MQRQRLPHALAAQRIRHTRVINDDQFGIHPGKRHLRLVPRDDGHIASALGGFFLGNFDIVCHSTSP